MTDGPGRAPDEALDAVLASYAAGSLSAPLHALVAAHLALAPSSRAFVRALEAAHGAALDAMEPKPISDREARIARILAQDAPTEMPPAEPDPVLPPPLVQYLGTTLGGVRWRPLLPGVMVHRVETQGPGEAILLRIRSGRTFPAHTHEGCEYTLVLNGGFSDEEGHYRRGDIAIADRDVDHRPRADEDDDCICYTVMDAPVRLTGPFGRVLQRLLPRR